MCGIFCFFVSEEYKKEFPEYRQLSENEYAFQCLKHRGPDSTNYISFNGNFIGFHRLEINGTNETESNQPFETEQTILVCNGEIYNHKDLERQFETVSNSKSDCEVILRLYEKTGSFEKTVSLLEGVYAIILYDKSTNTVYLARDRFGVRPLFVGTDIYGCLYVSSELKSLTKCSKVINSRQFTPDSTWNSRDKSVENVGYTQPYKTKNSEAILKTLFELAVLKRIDTMDQTVEYGFFLSGGLDSSLIAAVAAKSLANKQKKIRTFSIGWDSGNDLKYAKEVACFLGTEHTEVHFDLEEGINVLSNVIESIESYDITTVRASVPMWLLSRWVSQNTKIKVVFSGEGADELMHGYLYMHDAPDDQSFIEESKRLLDEIFLFDVLRADRCTAAHSLELRVPFLDKTFASYFENNVEVEHKKKSSNYPNEKGFIRKIFSTGNYLPETILYRKKEALSDGVGHAWVKAITSFVETQITDTELESANERWNYCTPRTKEAYYYRKIFEGKFGPEVEPIPFFWMPKFQKTEITDPSATVLDVYKS